ncbi:ArsO family NAD(P)H-dependent flavin-containing monooxygenase [Acinetobacter nosocomialis]|uniref:ArsO family NAD(P)H-dependent flavin-containing monooxygenase n=1 Tax=Acinetobacter nosocomialis TaxID=106654 RepID=UPI0026EF00C5|nr:ArsO family NAD(P)H-dependent flavin-containing monooxygenase [Acinetobacter nosocomialis]MDO7218863.1 ArsO family NAD(P)H-dependent flavin-containing monooxygenase [Acinetobacter nosocomialis]
MAQLQANVDVIIIGGGQAALSTAYFLKRKKIPFIILDDQKQAGGSWQHAWESLVLFSQNTWSSLSGWLMPATEQLTPTRNEVVQYLSAYEQRYQFPIIRPVHVEHVISNGAYLEVYSGEMYWRAKAVVSATGTWSQPFIPTYKGQETFQGIQIHSAHYKNAEPFRNKKVVVVGGGNSGAQIFAEVSKVTEAIWVTLTPPKFLPDDVDGRTLFLKATERLKQQQETGIIEPDQSVGGLGYIVMIDSVKEARNRGVLFSRRPFKSFTYNSVIWPDESEEPIDAVIWCTGFRAELNHLRSLNIVEPNNTIAVAGGRSLKVDNLWLVGYGEWTGMASATIIGVSRTSREAVDEIEAYLAQRKEGS